MISQIQGITFFFLLLRLSAGVQLNLTVSAAVAIVEDQTVVLTCSVGDVTDKNNTIYLKSVRHSNEIIRCYFNQYGSKCIAGSILGGHNCNCGVGTSDSDVKQYTLTRVVSGEDVASWYCENEKGIRSTAVIISFYYGPHDISVSGNQAGFDADGVNELSLICSTAEMFGSPLITWLNVTGGSTITNSTLFSSYGKTNLYKMQELKLIPHWFQDRNVIQCVVTNIETNKTVRSTDVTLDLIYPPMEAPVMTGNMDLKDSVQEGSVLDLTCKVSGGKPPVSDITIRCDGVEGSTNQTAEQSVVVGHFSFIVMRGFHKHNCTCSAEHQTGRYNLTSAVTVFVKYAPEVTITWRLDSSGTSVEVICSADGNPSNYNFKIRHFWGETYIREMRGELVESDKYTVKTSNTYMDAGTYQCGVSNDIQGLNNDSVQTANTHIEVDVLPVLLNETQRDESVFVVIGKPVSLNKIIFSRAKITVYTWMNEFGQNTTEISDLNITLNIYNKKVEDVGYKITLMISNVNETDLGVYTLKVCNRFGCDQFKTTITVSVEANMRSDPTSSNQVLIPAVSGAVAGVVVIIIIIVIVVCVVKRRGHSKQDKNASDNELNKEKHQEEIVMEDNELYSISSHPTKRRESPEMEDNELYNMSSNFAKQRDNPDQTPTGVDIETPTDEDISSVYSVVNKRGKATVDDVKTPTDEDMSPVYSVVNKHIKATSDDVKTSTNKDISALYSVVNTSNNNTGEDTTTPTDEDINTMYSVVNKRGKATGDVVETPTEEDIGALYSVVNTSNNNTGEDTTTPTDEDMSAMYSVVNKRDKATGDDVKAPKDEDISALYSVVNKRGKATGDGSLNLTEEDRKRDEESIGDSVDRHVKGLEDDERNVLSEDVSSMYTRVNKPRKKKEGTEPHL